MTLGLGPGFGCRSPACLSVLEDTEGLCYAVLLASSCFS